MAREKAADLQPQFLYNPHIWWDPIGPPWEVPWDTSTQKQITVLRLEHQKEVAALQQRTLDKAISAIKSSQ
jgi:hypothetical protein